MHVNLKLFASQAQHAGARDLTLALPDSSTIASALQDIRRQFPSLPWPQGTLVALNLEYAPEDAPLKDGDEVALIPPVSGG